MKCYGPSFVFTLHVNIYFKKDSSIIGAFNVYGKNKVVVKFESNIYFFKKILFSILIEIKLIY